MVLHCIFFKKIGLIGGGCFSLASENCKLYWHPICIFIFPLRLDCTTMRYSTSIQVSLSGYFISQRGLCLRQYLFPTSSFLAGVLATRPHWEVGLLRRWAQLSGARSAECQKLKKEVQKCSWLRNSSPGGLGFFYNNSHVPERSGSTGPRSSQHFFFQPPADLVHSWCI